MRLAKPPVLDLVKPKREVIRIQLEGPQSVGREVLELVNLDNRPCWFVEPVDDQRSVKHQRQVIGVAH